MKNKLNKCVQIVDVKSNEISNIFVEYLISAEDHRSEYHFGIDHIGIARALFIWLNKNKVQGASTIEQQFVRVVTSDYTNSLLRKFKEQILAVVLTKKRNKRNIAKAYLAIAYYGYKCEGTKGIKNYIGTELEYISDIQIISIIARLKYPKPLKDSLEWNKKHTNRINYIKFRHQRIAKSLRRELCNKFCVNT